MSIKGNIRIGRLIGGLAVTSAVAAALALPGPAAIASVAAPHHHGAARVAPVLPNPGALRSPGGGTTMRPQSVFWQGATCTGFGGENPSCWVQFSGSSGSAGVSNNPIYEWQFTLRCSLFGDQNSGANPPSNGWVQSNLGCNLGATPDGYLIQAL